MRCAYGSSEVARLSRASRLVRVGMVRVGMKTLVVWGAVFLESTTGCARASNEDDPSEIDSGKITDAGTDAPYDAGYYAQADQSAPVDQGSPVNGYDSGGVTYPDTGPIGGGDAQGPISACTGKTRVLTTSTLFLSDFESAALQGFYDYQATGALNVIALGTPGALGTAHAVHLAAGGLTSFGAGMGVTESCTDTSALDGISFWAKGTAGGDNKIQFQVAIPQTHAVANGGDCVTKCFDHPSKQLVLTPEWTQYVVPFSQLAQAGFGAPATYSGIIMALNWVSVDATSVDFWVDEIALYKGTAQTGPVGQGTIPIDP